MILSKGSRLRALAGATALGLVLGSGGCSVEWLNREPARELAQSAQPAGSLYAGWRVYQQRCAACHGADAGGGAQAPDLLQRLRETGPQRFAAMVLTRYDLGRPAAPGEAPQPGEIEMPAWQGEPVVNAHLTDLYAWLSARAQGRIGTERPAR